MATNSKIYGNNKSGYRGVYRRGKFWVAQIRINKVAKYLGTYDTPEEASVAYEKAYILHDVANKKHPRKTHGMSKTKIYSIWNAMNMRCTKPSQDMYEHYGGRGIKVCDRWKHSFDNFYSDIGKFYEPGLSIDRIDPDGDYTPDNCRWANAELQANNTTRNRWITVNGITKTLSQWSKITGINRRTIAARIDIQGLSPKEAIGG